MPTECEICTSIRRASNVSSVASENECFKERRRLKGATPEIQKRLDDADRYAPFVNSKRTIERTCDNFAHVNSVRVKRNKTETTGILESPFDHLKATLPRR